MITCPVCGKSRVTTPKCPQCGADVAPLQRLFEWPQAVLYSAWRAFEAGNATQAEKECQQAIALSPDQAPAHALMGRILEKRGDWELARHSYVRAAQLDGKNAEYKSAIIRLQTRSERMAARAARIKRLLWMVSAVAVLLLAATAVLSHLKLQQDQRLQHASRMQAELQEMFAADTLARASGLQSAIISGKITLLGRVADEAGKRHLLDLAGQMAKRHGIAVDDHLVIAVPESHSFDYVVQAGTSLSKIAGWFYGDPAKWPRIFESNRESVQDPSLILPGQRLRIPLD